MNVPPVTLERTPDGRMKFTWYVAFELPKRMKPRGGRRVPRATERFQNEAEAKQFARVKYAAGLKINAGTINPHSPKRAIAWADIHRWFEEGRAPETTDVLFTSGRQV
jgi:hypothetical protein